MGLLSAAMKAELRKATLGGRPEIYRLVDVVFPGGTKRYAISGAAAAAGQYDGRLLSIGDIGFSLPKARELKLATPEIDLEYEDSQDDFFISLLESANANQVRYSAVTITKASPNVAPAGWQTEFTGILDTWSQKGPKVWTWSVRPDDLSLQRFYPKQALTAADWPNASAAVLSKYGPFVYGKHDSGGNTGTGAIELPLVDSVLNRYVVCLGWAKSVDRVFADGILATTTYTVDHPIINGRLYTVVTFTSSQGTKAITADVQGYEAVGDGTGALISNPSDQLKHLLVNFIYGDYKSGTWLADASAPVDVTWFTTSATFLTTYGFAGSRRIYGDQRRGIDTLEEWCGSSPRIYPFWTQAGKLAIRPDDHRVAAVYLDDPWLREDMHEVGFQGLTYPTDQLIDRVSVKYLLGDRANELLQTLEVRDPALAQPAPDSLELPWSAAYLS